MFAEAQKLKSHFFVHRAPASSQVPGQPPTVLPTDTDRIRWGLISNSHLAAGAITLGLTDFLDPYPDVSVEVAAAAHLRRQQPQAAAGEGRTDVG